jgi:hypothetical protein
MDLNTAFIVNHSKLYTESRLASASHFRYGNGSPATSMIAVIAAGVRRAAATVERWARGASNADIQVAEHRLPRMTSVR